MRSRLALAGLPILLASCSGSGSPAPASAQVVAVVVPEPAEAPPTPKNVVFTAPPADPAAPPPVTLLKLPGANISIPEREDPLVMSGLETDGNAIWGSTGRDHLGNVYFWVSFDSMSSAHLYEYDPRHGLFHLRGWVLTHMARAGLIEPGKLREHSQVKIHTKILQAPDGFLYFASMDETGEKDDGSQLPTNGSHLWRTKPGSGAWEHLAAVPEGVIACAVGGRFVYYLGYFNHVLYRFDPATKKLEKKVVGSVGGHVSRNFFADDRGNVYVPRVTKTEARLVEFDEYLTEVA